MTIARLLLIIVMVAGTLNSVLAVGASQATFGSVDISPAHQELSVGGIADFTIGATSSLGGAVVVNVPAGLELVGTPICYSGCQVPFVSSGNDQTRVEFNLDGQSATVGFTIMADPAIAVGSTFYISAFLVGSPQAVEQTSASVLITSSLPTPEPPIQGPSVLQPTPLPTLSGVLEDNRVFYVSISPADLRIAPDGSVLYVIQAVRWGNWEGEEPNYEIEIKLPAAIELSSEARCGSKAETETHSACQGQIESDPKGSNNIILRPGYSSDGSTNKVFLPLKPRVESGVGSNHQILVTAQVDDDTLLEQPAPVEGRLLIVDVQALLSSQAPGVISAVIEVKTGFTETGDNCAYQSLGSDDELGLYDLGLETLLAKTKLGRGILGDAADGSGTQVCHFVLNFEGAPSNILYVFASGADSELGPCRACVYGFVTATYRADQIFLVE